MSSEQYSTAELIELYLDGEATEVESTQLFRELSDNVQMQQVFRQSMQLRSRITYFREQMQIPAETTKGLFARAGISQTPAVQTKPRIHNSKKMALLGGLFLSLAFMSGAAAYYFSSELYQNNKHDTVKTISAPLNNASADYRFAESTSSAHSAVDMKPSIQNTAPPMSKPIRRIVANSRNSSAQTHRDNYIAHNDLVEEAGKEYGDAAPSSVQTIDAIITIIPQSSVFPTQALYSQQLTTLQPRSNASIDMYDVSDGGNWLFGISGRELLRLFPNRSAEQEVGVFSNISAHAMYAVSPEHAFGVEVCRESMPIYIVDNNTNFQPLAALPWISLAYRYRAESATVFGEITPYLQANVGASQAGPAARATVGIVWEIDSRVQCVLGTEVFSLFYRYEGQQFATQKMGLVYGMSILY